MIPQPPKPPEPRKVWGDYRERKSTPNSDPTIPNGSGDLSADIKIFAAILAAITIVGLLILIFG